MLGMLSPGFENAFPSPDPRPDRLLPPFRTAAIPPAAATRAAPAIAAGRLAFSSTPPELAVGSCWLLVREALPRFVPLDFGLLAERERVDPDFALLDPFERLAAFRVEPEFALLELRELLPFRVEPFREAPLPLLVVPLELFFCVRVFV